MAGEGASDSRGAVVRDVLLGVRALADALDRMHVGMKEPMAVNATDLAALRMLVIRADRDELVTPRVLADHLRISTASTAKAIDRLVRAGFVERHPHPHDGRARVLVLTDRARSTFGSLYGERLRDIAGTARSYDDDELRVIARFLGDVAAAIEASDPAA